MKTLRNIFIGTWILIFCIASNLVYSQKSELSKFNSDSLYFDSPALFECKIQVPENYSLDKSYPLVISLHGGGSSYEAFKNIWMHFENPNFIMATPQAPYKWLMGDKVGYDWSGWPSGDTVFMKTALKLTSQYIENLILALNDKYKPSQVFLLGFSQGSIIAQIAGINNYDLLSGIIILSGPEINHPGKSEIVWPTEEKIRSASNLKVFIAHGKSDEIIDINIAHLSKQIYTKYGYDISLYAFDGGHHIDAGAMLEIEKWIDRQ